MSPYDFIIAGLGTAGSATCMTLARRGYKVLGIDAHRPPHTLGSHHGASRSVRRAYMEGTAYVPMAMTSWELWRKLEQDSGQELLIKTGNLTIGPADAPAVSGFAQSADTFNIPHEFLTAKEIKKRWPQLSPPPDFEAGLEKEAGIVFPELSIATFLAEAQKARAVVATDEPMVQWTEDGDHIRVTTTQQTYEAGRLLISAGAWTHSLLGLEKGVLNPKRVPVYWIEPPKNNLYDIGQFPVNFWQVPMAESSQSSPVYTEFYSLPVTGPGSKIKTAFHNGLTDCDPAALDRTVTDEEKKQIKHVIRQFFPGLDSGSLTSEVCMYTMTPDNHFYLGKRPGCAHVFGIALAGHGFKFAPVLGEILADLLAENQPKIDIRLFSPDRFRE